MPKYLFFIVILSLLASCAGRSRGPDLAADFILEGKLSVRMDDGQHNANFRWQQTAGAYNVEVWGLLGQGRTHLQGNTRHLSIRRGETVVAQGVPHEVMAEHLGFSLPMPVLWAWLQGQAAGRARLQEYDAEGRLTAFTERGWRVVFSRFRDFEASSGGFSPGRIVAARDHHRVTVAIRRFLQ